MTRVPVHFVYATGLDADLFLHARLVGSWSTDGRLSESWTSLPMNESVGEDGCPCFEATVEFDPAGIGQTFRWGVLMDGPRGRDGWGIMAEIDRPEERDRHRSFVLRPEGQREAYALTRCRLLGANKVPAGNAHAVPGLRFAVWAPHALAVEVVFADSARGYIADDGTGQVASPAPVPLAKDAEGVWQGGPAEDERLCNYAAFVGRPYMYRITRDDGSVAYRTDIFSRLQFGAGAIDPARTPWTGRRSELDGTVSCSVIVDPDVVVADAGPQGAELSAAEFWQGEFDPARPLPRRMEDLVIYEMHVGALNPGRKDAGDLEDAIALVPHLVDLGVNAVELLPISEFREEVNWGYATSHFAAVETSAGGRDALKRFVRECHRYGIAVILDVVYNHYHHQAERAQWAYDSNQPERNIWYWYEGSASDYGDPTGGYIDNMSTAWAPRFDEEIVRQLFISSAVAFITEFHIDGFRVDQTTSIHAYAVLHADGRPAHHARAFGAKFLRQWSRTLRLVKPDVLLMAEDHSTWEDVTKPSDDGGLGFDATWYADFYHHLVGDGEKGPNYAKLLRTAGLGDQRPLAFESFAATLYQSRLKKVVYNESHDEAGNAAGSARTIVTAVNGAPLLGETRRWAEARCRFAAALTVLSPGTPMFFMGEEVGAQKPYRYNDFVHHKEDILGERHGIGQALFRFYRDLVRLRLNEPALRSRQLNILHVHDANRVIAFRRWEGVDEDILVIASLADSAYRHGYTIGNERLPPGRWIQLLCSDDTTYGGWGIGCGGQDLFSTNHAITAVLPACGVVVFRRALDR
ncbi:alpha-amylase family glycosyl hydrolase [Geminicoccus sp.]|uniref:alpha-amylase family glycosyl hydrolase n=1 Tax=Geminicoccus sp. TaxID=2024832 RepID=UPI0032C223F5